MSLPRVLVAVLVTATSLSVASVATPPSAAEATMTSAAEAPRRSPAALSVSPSNYVGGQALRWTGNVGHRGARPLSLQFHMGRPGDSWTTVEGFAARTRADGSFSFSYPAPGMFNIRYRVQAGPYVSASRLFHAKTQDLTIHVVGQPGTVTNEPARVGPGDTFAISVDTTPSDIYRSPESQGLPVFTGRRLTLQRRVDPDSWRTVASGAVGSTGTTAFEDLSVPAGIAVFRVRAEDWTAAGSRIGWTQSFPLYVYAGRSAQARLDAQRSAAAAAPSGPPSRPNEVDRSSSAGTTASQRFSWFPSVFDFTWEHGESLSSPPGRGTDLRGSWLDSSTGAGRVSKYNGGLAIDSKRYNGAGIGDFGSTRAILRGNAMTYGRWESRLRVRSAYEDGGRDYKMLFELVPARPADYDCGQHNITVASVLPFSHQVDFGVRSPSVRWSGSAAAHTTPQNAAYAVAVEVAADHITWFLDGEPVGTVSERSAIAGVPMTLRYSLVGRGQSEMDQASLISDWQRAFPISTGSQSRAGEALRRIEDPAPPCVEDRPDRPTRDEASRTSSYDLSMEQKMSGVLAAMGIYVESLRIR